MRTVVQCIGFFATVFPFLRSNLPQAMEVWPPSLSDSDPLGFVCVIYRRDINRFSYNTKQSLITSIMEVFSNIPRKAVRRGCILFKLRLGRAIGAKDTLRQEMETPYPSK